MMNKLNYQILQSKIQACKYKTSKYYYDGWFTEKLDDEEELDDMPPLEGDEEVKEELKALTPNNLLIQLPISLAK